MSSNTKPVINNTTHKHNILKKYNYVSTRKIINALLTNGFFSAICEGKRGIGKSSYCLIVLQDTFLCMGYDKETAWNMALDHMLFTIPEIVTYLKKASNDPDEFCFCWDDAGVFGSNLRWFTHIKEIHLIQSLMDTIRGAVTSMLMTTPNQSQLLKFLRRYDNYIVQISYGEGGGWYRVAKGYLKYTLPSGKQLVYPKFWDRYSCYLPKWVYEKYMEKRDSYNVKNIKNLEEIIVEQRSDKKWKKK